MLDQSIQCSFKSLSFGSFVCKYLVQNLFACKLIFLILNYNKKSFGLLMHVFHVSHLCEIYDY